MKSKVLKIAANGKWEFVEVEGSRRVPINLETLQQAVGGYVECWNLDAIGLPDIDLWFNEEGKLKMLPINSLASLMSGIFCFGDLIVGDVLFCAHNGTGKSIGLDEVQEAALRRLIDKVTKITKQGQK